MADVEAVFAQSIDDAATAIRSVAQRHRYLLNEFESGPGILVFTKGMTVLSWGSSLTVFFATSTDGMTHVKVRPGETYLLGFGTDWGRGKRAARRLVTEAGAVSVQG